MDRHRIVMNFSVPPGIEDIEAMALDILNNLPQELSRHCEELAVQVDDFPDDNIAAEMELDDSYDLIALFRNGSEISPGVTKKVANAEDVLMLYRRPLLDMWCETGEDLGTLVRQVIIEELAQHFEFSEADIEDMTRLAS